MASTSLAFGAQSTRGATEPITPSGYDVGLIDCASVAPAFLGWVERQASADCIDLLLFTAPTGHTLHQLIQRSPMTRPPKAEYLEETAAALILAEKHPENFVEYLPCLTSGAQGMSIGEFLDRLEVPRPSAKFLDEIGLPAETLVTPGTQPEFMRFVYAYRWEILKVARNKRQNLFHRFLRAGVQDGVRVGIVDLGWSENVPLALDSILNDMFELETYSYCLCLRDDAEGLRRRAAMPTHAMICSDHYDESLIELIFNRRELIEQFFCSA